MRGVIKGMRIVKREDDGSNKGNEREGVKGMKGMRGRYVVKGKRTLH